MNQHIGLLHYLCPKLLQNIELWIARCLLEKAQYSKHFEHYNSIIPQPRVPNIREIKNIGSFSFDLA